MWLLIVVSIVFVLVAVIIGMLAYLQQGKVKQYRYFVSIFKQAIIPQYYLLEKENFQDNKFKQHSWSNINLCVVKPSRNKKWRFNFYSTDLDSKVAQQFQLFLINGYLSFRSSVIEKDMQGKMILTQLSSLFLDKNSQQKQVRLLLQDIVLVRPTILNLRCGYSFGCVIMLKNNLKYILYNENDDKAIEFVMLLHIVWKKYHLLDKS